jgi:hypothetical protein
MLRATAFMLLAAVQCASAATPLWTGSTYMDSIKATGADKLHAVGITGKGVSVAVVDTPFDAYNSHLINNIIEEACYGVSYEGIADSTTFSKFNAGMLDNLGTTDDGLRIWGMSGVSGVNLAQKEDVSHGTHVAGTVVAMAPDSGLILMTGASYVSNGGNEGLGYILETDFLLQKVAAIADQYNIVAVNGSYGDSSEYYKASDTGFEPATAAALKSLVAAGVTPVFAAGNEGSNNYLPSPAAQALALAVGSYGPDGTISAFSNLSAKVVLLAPGEFINSAIPGWTDQSEEGLLQGTSMAAPHVSGAIALLASGARNATVEEIYYALVNTGDLIAYDAATEPDRQAERDSARADGTLLTLYADSPLEVTAYAALRVDKAYAYLTSTRTGTLYRNVRDYGSPYADMIRAFGEELAAGVGDSSVIYQLLEGLSTPELARVAREMSPVILAAGSETIHVAAADLHGALGRRLSANRLNYEMQYDASMVQGYPKPMPNSPGWLNGIPGEAFTVWAEGSGGWLNREIAGWDRDYHSQSGGVTVGAETYFGGWTAGLFANVSRHEINGGGSFRTDIGALGAYGSVNQGVWYADGSLSIGWGHADSERGIHIPGNVYYYDQDTPIVYDAVTRTANGSTNNLGFNGRLAGGALLYDWGDWRLSAGADAFGAYLVHDGYRESGAGSLDLHLDRYNSFYVESGLTLSMTRLLRQGRRPLFATAKLGARYGMMFDHGLSGGYNIFGSRFKVDPELLSGFWASPELLVNWRVSDQVFMYASYEGRFGERRQGHTGRVGFEYAW